MLFVQVQIFDLSFYHRLTIFKMCLVKASIILIKNLYHLLDHFHLFEVQTSNLHFIPADLIWVILMTIFVNQIDYLFYFLN